MEEHNQQQQQAGAGGFATPYPPYSFDIEMMKVQAIVAMRLIAGELTSFLSFLFPSPLFL